MNKKNSLNIFEKYQNNNYHLVPITTSRNDFGKVKYFPAFSKEWKHSIYAFNKNTTLHFPINDINIYSLIKHYFNLRFIPQFIHKKYKPRWMRRPSMNKIYVSNTEVKHTNSKAIVTIYAYNREKVSLLNKIRVLKKRFFNNVRLLINKNQLYTDKFLNKTIKVLLYKKLKILRRYKLRLDLNNYKFEEKLLYRLSNILQRYFNKKVEFNIVNLKSIVLNSDIFTNLLVNKLWKKRINPLRMMNYILNRVVLPKVNNITEKSNEIKTVNFNLLENKYKNIYLTNILKNKKRSNVNKLLKESYNNVLSKNNLSKDYAKIYEILFNSIKYKNIGGVRLEVKGRLTKRYRADRSIYKLKWKGSLKNIESSYKGLSSVKMRGYLNSNVEYSMLAGKRRIGAFAVKGWISGK